ncbi:MAG: hypothetical protein IIA65_06710, partial [Planctomycetes bacterium]|nr:hypothetical protein [Planctomycetota bacterium]
MDGETLRRTWPAPVWVDGERQQAANALYQVDGSVDLSIPWQPGRQPIYLLIMTAAERDDLAIIGSKGVDGFSRAQKNGTFIGVDGTRVDVRYGVGTRNRGGTSRTNGGGRYRNNYRVIFIRHEPWHAVTALHIKNRFGYLQALGAAIFRKASLAAADTVDVQVRINGENEALANVTLSRRVSRSSDSVSPST